MKNKILLIPIFIFALIGILFIGTVIHENIHKFQYRDFAKNGTICLLRYPSLEADYTFNFNSSKKAEVENMQFKSEFWAYGSIFPLMIFFLFSVYKIFFEEWYHEKMSWKSI